MDSKVKGRVSSIQTLGTLDGPGIRYIVFLQGCPLRCGCCHNPETQSLTGGKEYSAEEILENLIKYKSYFGETGGITVSGGEPLVQSEFVAELFKLCREKGISTCIDTSGCVLNDNVYELLRYTDIVLLDIKYTDNDKYIKYVGCELSAPLKFLDELQKRNIPVWLRQVIIPSLNDDEDNIRKLAKIRDKYDCVEKTELLPFKKLCKSKYEKLNMPFAFKDIPEPTKDSIKKLESILEK